jgi:hypothetical protein
MRELSKLACLFVGNISKWLFYGGKKSMDDILKEDNEILGLVILGFIFFFSYKILL